MIKTTTFSEIAVVDEFDWARLLWEESTGRVIVLSAYGNWSYCWTHIGSDTLPQILASLHMGYMGGKFLGSHLYEYSLEDTVSAIRQAICELRKTGSWSNWSKKLARKEWGLVAALEDGEIDFREWHDQTELDDAYEYRRTEIRADWVSFWERVWVKLILPELAECCVKY